MALLMIFILIPPLNQNYLTINYGSFACNNYTPFWALTQALSVRFYFEALWPFNIILYLPINERTAKWHITF